VKSVEPFMTGFIQDNNYIHRPGPADVMVAKDGSLLVSDDWNGAVYRITYGQALQDGDALIERQGRRRAAPFKPSPSSPRSRRRRRLEGWGRPS